MTPGEIGYMCGGIFGSFLFAFLISRLFKDKDKRLTAFIITLVIFLFGAYNSTTRELKQNEASRAYYNAQRTAAMRNAYKTPETYRANLPQNKSIQVSSQYNKIHVSRTEGTNAQQVFLDNCELSSEEQSIYKNNAEFQKAFTVLFTLDSQNRLLHELSNKCSGVDLLKTNNPNKLRLDRELSKSKEVFIKHLGQSQYDCFEKHVLQDFGAKVAPAGAGAMYAQLQTMAAGRVSTCSLLADRTFQAEMYSSIADTMNKVINNDNPLAWKALFNINLPEQNDFDIHISGDKVYMK